MVDNHHIDDLFKSALDPMEQVPSEKARLAVEAALDKKRALLYQRKANRYRLALALLALLLISFVAYNWLLPSGQAPASSDKLTQSAPKEQIKTPTSVQESNTLQTQEEAITLPHTQANLQTEAAKSNAINANGQAPVPISEPAHHTAPAHTHLDATAFASSPTTYTQSPNPSVPAQFASLTSVSHVPLIAVHNIQNPFTPYPETPQTMAEPGLLPLPTSTSRSLPLSLALHYSPQYSFNYLTDNKPDHIDDAQMYKDRESGMYAFNTGLNIRYHFNDMWAVALGIGFSSTTKSIKLPMVYATEGESTGMHYEYPTASGMIHMPNPYSTTLHEGDSLALGHAGTRTIQYFNIPATIRYHLPQQKIKFFVEGGLLVHFRLSEQVAIDMGSSVLKVKNASDGLNKINYGWMLGAGAEMPFTEKLSLFAEPTLHGAFTSITKNIAVNNYPYAVGLRAGASIKF